MKKVSFVVLMLLIPLIAIAGKQVTTPSALLLNSDKIELINAIFEWGAIPAENRCLVTYKVWNNDRTALIREITYVISGADFTSLITGYGSMMETRLETDIWQDIQNRFELVP